MALALCLAFSCITLSSNSQTTSTSTTGNLINYGTSPTDTTSIWNNGVYVNQLCFQYGQPGNCGPNPSIRDGNNINFSYGTVDLNQIVNINRALSISGSIVQLNGFNFGFTAKNGNGWDDGRQDYLSAYVKLYGSTGSQVASYDYTAQTNQRYNWTQFNFSETFATPYTASTLSNAQVGFVGRDNNFWAGTYGPEIYNVNFSLKYSTRPDPCIADPLSSPLCPGYALATVKNSILGSTVSNASVTSFVPTINYALASPTTLGPAAGLDLANPAPGTQGPMGPAAGPQGPQGPMGPAAGPQGQDPNQNSGGPQDSPSQPGPQGPQQGPAAGPQPAGGPPQQAQSAPPPSSGPSQAGPAAGPGRSNDGPKMTPGAALSVARAAQEKDKAVQATAVQNAAKAFENIQQSAQATSNVAVSMNQEMSANSATAAAQVSSQTTQASQQAAVQASQGSQQTAQVSAQAQQATRAGPQVQQQQQQEVEQVQTQTSSLALAQAPQQQETQQAQAQTSTSVVKLLPPPQQEQPQASSQLTASQMATPIPVYVQPAQPQPDAQSTQVAILKAPTPMVIETQQQSSNGTGLTVSRNLFAYNPLLPSNTANMSAPLPAPQPTYQPRLDTRSSEVEILQPQVAAFGSRAGNPLSEIILQQQFEMMQTSIVQPTSSVNRNVLPNELAGSIDIASMASIPTGFNAYSVVLKDAAFYEPKEVYKNQRTVDNARVLRGLTGGSDALHQRMIDLQYK